jgi:ATP-dependent DNA ligase
MTTFKTWPILYKRSVNGKISQYQIEVENNRFRTISGYTDGIKTISEWTQCEGKNIGKKNETTPNQQAEAEAKAMWDKKIELGSFMDINNIDKSVYFKPMLAHDFNDHKNKIKYPVYSQPKLDGIRCIVRADGMWSRNGKKIISAPHVFNALSPLFDINPDLIFDGELYADKFANDFNTICSLVKKTKPTSDDLSKSAESIQYHVYDLPSYNASFTYRYKHLNKLITNYHPSIVLVKTDQIDNINDLLAYYEDYIMEGYEGQMIRLDSEYESKRSKSLLKHKSFIDEEYTILAVIEGIGNKTGMVGSFLFMNKDGKTFNSSPKFNWDECKQMWNERETLIGKQATVKYFNLTPGDSPVPRFPYVIKIDRESYE